MRATVIDISDKQIYLEIGQQLRFKSNYVSVPGANQIMKSTDIDFVFGSSDGHPCVIIEDVIERSRGAVSRA